MTDVKPMMTREGDPMGRITIEDFDGQGEFALFKENWAKYQNMLAVGNSIFLKMKAQERPYQPGVYSLNVMSIDFLSKIEEDAEKAITIYIDMDKMKNVNGNDDQRPLTPSSLRGGVDNGDGDGNDDEDDNENEDGNVNGDDEQPMDDSSLFAELATMIKANPGKLQLSIVIRDSTRSSRPLHLHSRLPGVKLNRQLLDFISSHNSLSVTM